MSNQLITKRIAIAVCSAALGVVLPLTCNSCGQKVPPAVLDPLVAACASDLAQWSYVQQVAPGLNLTADQLARALCSIPAVILSYQQKTPDAANQAKAAVQRLSAVRPLNDAGAP